MQNSENENESPTNKNSSTNINKEKQQNHTLSPILKYQNITTNSLEINPKIYRERTLSPQTPKETINNMLQKMEMNNKNYPSKANFFKNESNEQNNKYYSPRTNSPIVDYYAGINHSNYYSPENDLNFKNKNNDENNNKFFPLQNINLNNNNIFMNNQYSNFNFSPSTIFNKDQRRLSNASNNDILNISNNNNNNINNNINNIIGTSLQEKIEENLQKNLNQISINNNDDDGDNENQELYMLSFNSDEENNDDNDNDSNNENTQYTLNIDDDNQETKIPSYFPKTESKYIQNLNLDFSNNFIPKNLNRLNQPNNIIPPPTNILKPFNNINNQNTDNNTFNNDSNNNNNNNNTTTKNQNTENQRLNMYHYYSNYMSNYMYNHFNRIPAYNEDFNNPNKPRTITAQDLVTTITANNKKIKRIDPNSYINESYEYLSHNIFLLAKDQAGCRFLQKKLDDEPEVATMHFYPAILPYISPLVKDPFGNYLIQKLCSNLKPDQIKEILLIISQNVLEIGSNSHGTRVIQNLINCLSNQDLINSFIKMIEPYIIPLLKELNGTHIIQKFINDFPQYSSLINNIVIDNCISLATHRHGCCVLQKYLDNVNKDFKKRLVKILIDNTLVLIIDQFGNYVIQSIFQLKNVNDSNLIVEKLAENAPYYSKHKYSSNVVEKCFDACDENHRKIMIKELSDKDIMNDLILDEHGNYVIQKVISCAEKSIQSKMIDNLIEIIPKLKNVSFGERILNRLSLIYPKLSNVLNNNNGNNNNKKGKGRYNKRKYEPLNINGNQGKNQKFNNNK